MRGWGRGREGKGEEVGGGRGRGSGCGIGIGNGNPGGVAGTGNRAILALNHVGGATLTPPHTPTPTHMHSRPRAHQSDPFRHVNCFPFEYSGTLMRKHDFFPFLIFTFMKHAGKSLNISNCLFVQVMRQITHLIQSSNTNNRDNQSNNDNIIIIILSPLSK